MGHVGDDILAPPPPMTSSPTQTLSRVCRDASERLASQPTVAGRGLGAGAPTGDPHSHSRAFSPASGRGPKGPVGQCPGGPMHTLPPLAGCTGMQMRARVTSGGKSSAIFSFWPCWEEGTGSRGGGRAPRRGSRRAGRRRARARGPGGPRRRGERRRGTRRRRCERPAVGTTPAQPRGDAPGPARPCPAQARGVPTAAAAPPRPAHSPRPTAAS